MGPAPTIPTKPDLYVVARFLERLCEPNANYSRSKLQAAVRLNYDLFRSYLGWLQEKGFVVDSGASKVAITPAGVAAHAELVGWIRRVLGATLADGDVLRSKGG